MTCKWEYLNWVIKKIFLKSHFGNSYHWSLKILTFHLKCLIAGFSGDALAALTSSLSADSLLKTTIVLFLRISHESICGVSVGMGACLAVELLSTHGLGQYPLSKLPVFHLLFPPQCSCPHVQLWCLQHDFHPFATFPLCWDFILFLTLDPSLHTCCLGKALAWEVAVWLFTFSYLAFHVWSPREILCPSYLRHLR